MYKEKAKAVCKDKEDIKRAYKYYYIKWSGGIEFYSRLDCIKYWVSSFFKSIFYIAVSPLILLLGIIALVSFIPFCFSMWALDNLNKYEWPIRFINDIFYVSKKSNRDEISVYKK